MELVALLVDHLIRLSLRAETWEQVLRRLAQDLHAAGRVHPTYEDAIVARERTFPTGLAVGDIGVAIPHADVEHVRDPAIAIATLAAPVAFGEMGNPGQAVPVRIVFMLAIHQAEAMVGVLQELVGSFQQPGALAAILGSRTPADVRAAFGEALRAAAAPPGQPAGGAHDSARPS